MKNEQTGVLPRPDVPRRRLGPPTTSRAVVHGPRASAPAAGRRAIEAADLVRQDLTALLAAWHTRFGNQKITVAKLIADAAHDEALTTALHAVAGDRRGGINARSLGKFLSRHDKRREGGYAVSRDEERNHVRLWHVVVVGTDGVSGISGVCHLPSRENDNEEFGRRGVPNPAKPSNPDETICRSCQGHQFWRPRDGDIACARCHPPPSPELVEGRIDPPRDAEDAAARGGPC